MKSLKTIKIIKILLFIVLVTFIALIFFSIVFGTVAIAGGLVDDTIDSGNAYSKYPLQNYQLDFYVDNSWGWLPWNWLDGIGKQVMYGLYAITNFIWTISLFLSSSTGYLVQEAYSLDFISATADAVGHNIQTIAGVTTNGLSTDGFYVGFLLIIILFVGVYVTYTGLVKRESTKAIHAIINFVVVFLLSASFIAYAPEYIKKINDFSSDISNSSLSLGTKIVMPNSQIQGRDSVDLIRDSLFAIQVQQPWYLLQYGNSNINEIGEERVEKLLSINPDSNNGEDREKIVIEEIEKRENNNLTITKTINRLGMVFFIFIFNIGISIFVFLLTGIMIFSQVLFIIYAMFLPVGFILSMIPTFESMSKRAVTKLFNTILTRAGITLIITVAFSISTMLYSLSTSYPFFLVAFLQIVTFAGIYFKLSDLMSMFSLNSSESQVMGRQILSKPRMQMHRLQHRIARSVASIGSKGSRKTRNISGNGNMSKTRSTQQNEYTMNRENANNEKMPLGKRAGQIAGKIIDTKDYIQDTTEHLKNHVTSLPVNAEYAVYKKKKQVSDSMNDFCVSMNDTRNEKQTERKDRAEKQRQRIIERRLEMERASQSKNNNIVTMGDRTTSNINEKGSENSAIWNAKEAVKELGKDKKPEVKNTLQEKSIERPTAWNAKEDVKELGKDKKPEVKNTLQEKSIERPTAWNAREDVEELEKDKKPEIENNMNRKSQGRLKTWEKKENMELSKEDRKPEVKNNLHGRTAERQATWNAKEDVKELRENRNPEVRNTLQDKLIERPTAWNVKEDVEELREDKKLEMKNNVNRKPEERLKTWEKKENMELSKEDRKPEVKNNLHGRTAERQATWNAKEDVKELRENRNPEVRNTLQDKLIERPTAWNVKEDVEELREDKKPEMKNNVNRKPEERLKTWEKKKNMNLPKEYEKLEVKNTLQGKSAERGYTRDKKVDVLKEQVVSKIEVKNSTNKILKKKLKENTIKKKGENTKK